MPEAVSPVLKPKARQSVVSLNLTRFRSYPSLRFSCDERPVIITGDNGAGKTNILEAVSLLMPGRGLRKATLDRIDYIGPDIEGVMNVPWAVSAKINSYDGEYQVGIGRDTTKELGRSKKVMKIDGEVVPGNRLAELCTVIWLTPQMDGVFIDGTSSRRKLLDRLVFHFDPTHATRLNAYDYAMRERAKLLQQSFDPFWVKSLEKKMAESAIAIAAARIDTINMIQQTILQASSAFPKARLAVKGWVEEQLQAGLAALQLEEMLCDKWEETRYKDRDSGRTNVGTHRSDFEVFHMEKQMIAEYCSTGEQKALLLSIVLSEVRARAAWSNSIPIVLLDEVVAHLDHVRREALFEEVISIGAQAWLTGTDLTIFEPMLDYAQQFVVQDGGINVG